MSDWSDTPCKLWQGSTDYKGFGQVFTGGTGLGAEPYTYAHREAWKAVNGEVPDGIKITHYCDGGPACIEVRHLRADPLVGGDWERDRKWAEDGVVVKVLPPGTSIIWFGGFDDEGVE